MSKWTPYLKAVLAIGEATDNPLTQAKALALLSGYSRKYSDDIYVPEQVEVTKKVTVKGTDGTPVTLGCITDTICRDVEGNRVALEHKTVSPQISTHPGAAYWSQLDLDFQSNLTSFIWAMADEPIAYTIQDVIVKPSFSRKRIPKGKKDSVGTLWEIENKGTYLGEKGLGEPEGGLESARMFQERLTEDTWSRPDHYYKRSQPVYRSLDETIKWAQEQLFPLIRDMSQGPRYRNPGFCLAYNSVCPFFGLCRGISNVEDFEKKLDDDFTNVVTKSKVATWQGCREKYRLKYEEKLDATDSASYLEFGKVFHEALETFWKEKIPS